MKSQAERAHDEIVRRLERQLEGSSGRQCISFLNYHKNGLDGEIDVLATLPNGSHEFYEVKLHYHPNKHGMAIHQYERYLEAFQRTRTNCPGFLITGDGQRRRL